MPESTLEATATNAAAADVATAVDTTASVAESGIGDDAGDIAAALSALKGESEAETPAADASATPAAEVTPDAVVKAETATSTPKVAADDADWKAIQAKIARLEFDRDQLTEKHTSTSAKLTELEAHSAELAELKANPIKALEKLGFSPEAVLDYVQNGPKKVDPALTAQERRLAELEKLASGMQAQQAAAQQASKVSDFKATIPGALETVKGQFPLLHGFHETPGELADAVFGLMESAYRSNKTELTVAQAAKQIEDVLTRNKARYDRLGKPAATTAAAKSPASPGLTNAPPKQAAAGVDPDDLSDEDALTAAIAALKGN